MASETDTRTAAEQGDARAQVRLGLMYERGQAVPKDRLQAVKWFRLAAEQGNAEGQWRLGIMYQVGRSVPEDHVQAVKWFHLAAEQDFYEAFSNLSYNYSLGLGVPQDDVLAYMWAHLATIGERGRVNANIRDRIALRMTSAQVAEAKRLWRERLSKGRANAKSVP